MDTTMIFNIITIATSVIAIVVAGYTAWIQNRIELFPKRQEAYEKYLEIGELKKALAVSALPPYLPQNDNGWALLFSSQIINKSKIVTNSQDVIINLIDTVKEDNKALNRIEMLFRLKTKNKQELSEIINAYNTFTSNLISFSTDIKNEAEIFLRILNKNYDEVKCCLEKQCRIR